MNVFKYLDNEHEINIIQEFVSLNDHETIAAPIISYTATAYHRSLLVSYHHNLISTTRIPGTPHSSLADDYSFEAKDALKAQSPPSPQWRCSQLNPQLKKKLTKHNGKNILSKRVSRKHTTTSVPSTSLFPDKISFYSSAT